MRAQGAQIQECAQLARDGLTALGIRTIKRQSAASCLVFFQIDQGTFALTFH